MLVLSRKLDEAIQIGPDITISVAKLGNGEVRLAIDAPLSVSINREEVVLDAAEVGERRQKRAASRERRQERGRQAGGENTAA